jgi:hypothetical protein
MQIFVADLTLLEFVRRATNSIFRWVGLGWGRVGGKSAGMVWGDLEELVGCYLTYLSECWLICEKKYFVNVEGEIRVR